MIEMKLNANFDYIKEVVAKKIVLDETLSNSFMYRDFLNSGISKETIDKYVKGGYLSETNEYWQLYYPALYANYKTDYYSRRLRQEKNSSGKYRKPKGQTTRLFRPLDLSISVLKDPNEYIILTEGDKKAIKATQEGFNCISLSGVWNWKKKIVDNDYEEETENTDKNDDLAADIIDDLAQANFNNKQVYLCYDSDMWRNSKVYYALYSLAAYLISEKKAIVKIIELPEGEAKGLDDFLCVYGAKEFLQLMNSAKIIKLKDIQNKLAGKKNTVEFPLDFFPEEVANTIIDLHKKLDAPIEYLACTILTTISIIMDGHFTLKVKPSSNWIEYPILWTAIIGNPSQKKTPCLK